MNKLKRSHIFYVLKEKTPSPTTELIYKTPFELLISVILSAQATDISVNKATKRLFAAANTPEDIISLGLNNLKKHIKALNKQMKEAAGNLEFEEAAKIRDEIRKLESTELEVTLNPKVKKYSKNNKMYPKGRSTMGMPGTRAQKGKKKWKQIK